LGTLIRPQLPLEPLPCMVSARSWIFDQGRLSAPAKSAARQEDGALDRSILLIIAFIVPGTITYFHRKSLQAGGSAAVKSTPKKGKKSQGGSLFALTKSEVFGFNKSTSSLLRTRHSDSSAGAGCRPKVISQKGSFVHHRRNTPHRRLNSHQRKRMSEHPFREISPNACPYSSDTPRRRWHSRRIEKKSS
jgi:hypothetical protein